MIWWTWPHDSDASIPDYTLPAIDPDNPIPPMLTYTFNFRVRREDYEVPNGASADFVREWVIAHETSGIPIDAGAPDTGGGCSASGRGLSNEQLNDLLLLLGNAVNDEDHTIMGLYINAPYRIIKGVDYSVTPPPILVEGQNVKYVISGYNLSETTDLTIVEAEESLFDDLLALEFCNSVPVPQGSGLPLCTSGTTVSNTGNAYRYQQAVTALAYENEARGLWNNGNIISDNNGMPMYQFDRDDVTVSLFEEFIVNRVTDKPFVS